MNDNSFIQPTLKVLSSGAMDVSFNVPIPKTSVGVINQSSAIDYETMRQTIENYISKLKYVEDIKIGSDGVVTIINNNKE